MIFIFKIYILNFFFGVDSFAQIDFRGSEQEGTKIEFIYNSNNHM